MSASIFVVDSSPAVRRMVEQISAPEGFDVVGFHDGPTALEAARQHSPSLIIADYHLDSMTFSGFCKAINALDHLTDTFVISLVDAADHPDEQLLRTLGVKAFIKKPFQSEELLEVIRSIPQRSASSNSLGLKRRTWPPSADADEDSIHPIIGATEPEKIVRRPINAPLSAPSPAQSSGGPEDAMKGLLDQLVSSVRTQTEKKLTDILPQAIEGNLANHVRPMVQKELQAQLGSLLSQEYLTGLIRPLVTQILPTLLKQELAANEPLIRQTLSDLTTPLVKATLGHDIRIMVEPQIEIMVRQHLPSVIQEQMGAIDQGVKDEVHRVVHTQVAELTHNLVRTTAEQTVERAVQQVVPEVAEQQIKAEIKRLLETEAASNRSTN